MATRMHVIGAALIVALAIAAASAAEKTAGRPYRLKSVDLKQQVLWGGECLAGEGQGLAFGGMDQKSDDGRPHTRVLEGGQWKAIHEELRAGNPLQARCEQAWAIRNELKDTRARVRSIYFQGLPQDEEARLVGREVQPAQKKLSAALAGLIADLAKAAGPGEYETAQAAYALGHLRAAAELCRPLDRRVEPEAILTMRRAQVHVAQAAEALDAEPPARALSPIAYDAAGKLYVIFGGDHLDYLTNDTWVFDPAGRKWRQRHPAGGAPAPRANHALTAGDGKIKLVGGYTYTSNTDYCGGQYADHDDGEHVYDLAADRWSGAALAPADTRVYRTGPFLPDFYLQGNRPDAATFAERLAKLPTNQWVPTDPPYRPKLNRDWGTAILDADRDLILRWSGGHSAHGGTDVPHFHLASNRWELAYPVEFPLGQLYSNTSYPAGFNFNRRPGMTGHTYQNYGYDPLSRRMIQTGHRDHFYIYDPDKADWVARGPKPKPMVYSGCFYSLTLCTTPKGLLCWTQGGEVLRYDPAGPAWVAIETTGDKLPGAVTDNSTMVYDSKRDRVVFLFRRRVKDATAELVYVMDVKTGRVEALAAATPATANITWLDRGCYDGVNDLVLLATYLKPGKTHTPTPAFDCAAGRWVTLDIAYDVKPRGGNYEPRRAYPHGHSCGLMYDPKRRLIWGTDTDSQVYVLKLSAKSAGARPL